ncbi:MAG: RNA polymerase sigma factor [Longimicrobiales bacterium]
MESLVERELVRKCRAGESRFFEPFVRAYEGDAVRIARALLGDLDAARDAAQEAFVKAYRALATFDEARRFGPWFFQILRNHCRDMVRHRTVVRRIEVPASRLGGWYENAPDDDRTIDQNEVRELLWKGLEAIEPAHREVLVMKELEGLSYTEIAAQLDIPEGTVASRLYHARRALRDSLVAMGVEYP